MVISSVRVRFSAQTPLAVSINFVYNYRPSPM